MKLESREDKKREAEVVEMLDLWLEKEGYSDFTNEETPAFDPFDRLYRRRGKPWFYLEIKCRKELSTAHPTIWIESSKYRAALATVIPVRVIAQWSDKAISFQFKLGYQIIERKITHPKTREEMLCEFVEIPMSDGKILWKKRGA